MIFERATVTRLAAALTVESASSPRIDRRSPTWRRASRRCTFLQASSGKSCWGMSSSRSCRLTCRSMRCETWRTRPRAPSMEAMAARFCAEITAFQPEGPLSLAGYSFGGLLAYEMARQLRGAGRQIAMLAIFDTGPAFSKSGSLKDTATRIGLCLENLPRWIAEDVIRTTRSETPGRLWRSVRKLVRSLVTRHHTAAATPGSFAKVEHLFDVSSWSPALMAHVENNLCIIGGFRFGPYDGQVTLFPCARASSPARAHLGLGMAVGRERRARDRGARKSSHAYARPHPRARRPAADRADATIERCAARRLAPSRVCFLVEHPLTSPVHPASTDGW